MKEKWKSARYRQMIIRKVLFCISFFLLSSFITLKVSGFLSNAKGNEANYYKYYTSITIMPGDSLYSLAETHMDNHFNSSDEYIKEIRIVNQLEDDSLTAGMNLIIPYYSTDFR